MYKKILSQSNLAIALLFAVCSQQLFAQFRLPNIFGNNMVLQQKSSVPIWGWADPGTSIELTTSWNNQSLQSQTTQDGTWKIVVETPSAGGPYQVSISNKETLTLTNIMIGEVWICSGQSNMQMPLWGYKNQPIHGSTNEILGSGNKELRVFTVNRETSNEPRNDFEGSWLMSSPENARSFSATAYYFGQLVQKVLDVPVGLVVASWGGTRIEPWISSSTLDKFDFIDYRPRPPQHRQQNPSVLFNAMINPIVDYPIQGAIWYQGEANKDEPDQYIRLLPGLIEDWRKHWDDKELSFYYAQIAPYKYKRGLNSAYLREAQLKVSQLGIDRTGMVSLMDVGEPDNIHPANKRAVGERLAYLALADTYGLSGFESSGPVLKDMKVVGNIVDLTFDHAENGLTTFGKPLEHFMLAGSDGRFFPATAVITGSGIRLLSPKVSEPVDVRYAFDDFVIGVLFNVEGLPASSFRTDSTN